MQWSQSDFTRNFIEEDIDGGEECDLLPQEYQESTNTIAAIDDNVKIGRGKPRIVRSRKAGRLREQTNIVSAICCNENVEVSETVK